MGEEARERESGRERVDVREYERHGEHVPRTERRRQIEAGRLQSEARGGLRAEMRRAFTKVAAAGAVEAVDTAGAAVDESTGGVDAAGAVDTIETVGALGAFDAGVDTAGTVDGGFPVDAVDEVEAVGAVGVVGVGEPGHWSGGEGGDGPGRVTGPDGIRMGLRGFCAGLRELGPPTDGDWMDRLPAVGHVGDLGCPEQVRSTTKLPAEVMVPTEAARLNLRLDQQVAGIRTVEDSISHLIVANVTVGRNGHTVRAAMDSLCGPVGVIDEEQAKRAGYDLSNLDTVGGPIHGVDGSPLGIRGRLNGVDLWLSNRHCITVDLLVSTNMALGVEIILGMPCLVKIQAVLNCARGVAHFVDNKGEMGLFGNGVSVATTIPTPAELPEVAVGAVMNTCDITAAVRADTGVCDSSVDARVQGHLRVVADCGEKRTQLHREVVHFLGCAVAGTQRHPGREGTRLRYPGLKSVVEAVVSGPEYQDTPVGERQVPFMASTFWQQPGGMVWSAADRLRVDQFRQRYRAITLAATGAEQRVVRLLDSSAGAAWVATTPPAEPWWSELTPCAARVEQRVGTRGQTRWKADEPMKLRFAGNFCLQTAQDGRKTWATPSTVGGSVCTEARVGGKRPRRSCLNRDRTRRMHPTWEGPAQQNRLYAGYRAEPGDDDPPECPVTKENRDSWRRPEFCVIQARAGCTPPRSPLRGAGRWQAGLVDPEHLTDGVEMTEAQALRWSVAAYAQYEGWRGPNQRSFSRPDGVGNSSNRSNRVKVEVHESLYQYNRFLAFLAFTAHSDYTDSDTYYRRVHRPSANGEPPPWGRYAAGRKAGGKLTAERWMQHYREQTTISDAYLAKSGHQPMVQFDSRQTARWDRPGRVPVYARYAQERLLPELKAVVHTRRRRAPPLGHDSHAHLIDGPEVAAEAIDVAVLAEAAAEAAMEYGPAGRAVTYGDKLRHGTSESVAKAMSELETGRGSTQGEPMQRSAVARVMTDADMGPAIQVQAVEHELTAADEFRTLVDEHCVGEYWVADETARPGMRVNCSAVGEVDGEETWAVHLDERANAWLAADDELRRESVMPGALTEQVRAVAQTVNADPEVQQGDDYNGDRVVALLREHWAGTTTEAERRAGPRSAGPERRTPRPEDSIAGTFRTAAGGSVPLPGASQELIDARDKEHDGPVPKLVHDMMDSVGVSASFFKAEFTDWDRQHFVSFKLKDGAEPPPPEYRKIPKGLMDAVAENLRSFYKAGWIQRVHSCQTAAPLVIVKKKTTYDADGKPEKPQVRVCVDFGALNKVLKARCWAMPDVVETIHSVRDLAVESYRQMKANRAGSRTCHDHDDPDLRLGANLEEPDEDPGSSVLGCTDVTKAFHRVGVAEEDRDLLTFAAPGLGLWRWVTLPMGASISPQAFCSISSKMLERANLLYQPGVNDTRQTAEYLRELYLDMVDQDWRIDGIEMRDRDGRTVPTEEVRTTTDGLQLYIDGWLAPSQFALIYVDDLIIAAGAPDGFGGMAEDGAAMHEHHRQWKLLIAVCRHQRLFLSSSKTLVGTKVLKFLGYSVCHSEMFADPERVVAIAEIPEPKSKSDCRCFAGLCNFYSRFCEGFALLMRPIYAMTKDDKPDNDITGFFTVPLPAEHPQVDTHWGVLRDCQAGSGPDGRYTGETLVKEFADPDGRSMELSARESWQRVKDELCKMVLLAQPDPSKPMTIFTDSSQYAGAGAIAVEVAPGKLRVFDLWAKSFTGPQTRYSASEREALSVVTSVIKWYGWLVASKFTVRMTTDHQALLAVRKKINNARITSWFQALQGLDFDVYYLQGTADLMLVPDALSRIIRRVDETEAESQWEHGEHWATVPCFKQIFAQVHPGVKIHDGTDTFDRPTVGIAGIGGGGGGPIPMGTQMAQAFGEAAAAEVGDEESTASEVFSDPDAADYDLEQDFDEADERAMAKFTDEVLPPQLDGAGGRRGQSAAMGFFDARMATMTRVSVDRRQLGQQRRLDAVAEGWPAKWYDVSTPASGDLAGGVQVITRAQQQTVAVGLPAGHARGTLVEMSVFECDDGETPERIARRFGLDVGELVKWNRQWCPRKFGKMTPKSRLQVSTIRLAPVGQQRDAVVEMTSVVDHHARTAVVADDDAGQIYTKSVHGPLATKSKGWALNRAVYRSSKDFGALYKRLERGGKGKVMKQDATDPRTGKLKVIGMYAGDFSLSDGHMYYLDPVRGNWRLVVPEGPVRGQLMGEFHTVFQSHPSAAVMYALMRERVWWPAMAGDCVDYCRRCEHCQRNKNPTHKQGRFSMPTEPTEIGQVYHLDLITDLPPAGSLRYDSVLAITDRASRRTWLLPTHRTLTGIQAAEIFLSKIVLSECRGPPIRLFSDRGPQFVSLAWTTLNTLMGTAVHLSSGHEHKLNGLSERHIASAETLLRGESYDQSRWIAKLKLAEFAMNSLRRVSLGGHAPIEIETGRLPSHPLDLSPGILQMRRRHKDVDTFLNDLRLLRAEINEGMKSVKDIMRGRYDRHRDGWDNSIQAGDKVWLNSKDVAMPIDAVNTTAKLKARFYGPYTIEAYVGPQTVKLRLPESSNVHPDFHVSKIKKWYRNDAPGAEIPEPDMGRQHEVQAVLLHRGDRGDKGNLQYLVAWRGFTAEDSTWTSATNIEASAPKRIAEYWTRRKVVREYDQRVKTADDLAVFAMMGTADTAQSPQQETIFSEDSLMVVGEEWAKWAGASGHPTT